MQVQKVLAALDQIEAAMAADKLTDQMVHNAMINLDRVTPCFGRSASDWRVVVGFENGAEIVPKYTAQNLREFVADKRAMFAVHPYMFDRA